MNEELYWMFIDVANGLLSGSMLGGYYAVIAIGLALNFGVMRLVNLAHGDWLILAAYLAVAFLSMANVSPFWTLALVIPVMYVIGYLIQRLLLNRVSVQAAERKGMSPSFGLMSPLLVTFGMSIVIGQGLLAIFDSNAAAIRNDLSFAAIRLGEDLSISTLRLIFFGIALVMLAVVQTFLNTTHMGCLLYTSDAADE